MALIQLQTTLVHANSGLTAASVAQRTTVEDAFTSNAIAVTTTPEAVALGDVVIPRNMLFKLLSGGDVLISTDGGTLYPLSVSLAGDSTVLNFDSRTTSAITCVADTAGSLGGKYFVIHDVDGPVWVWLDTGNGAGVAASGSITYGVPVATDTVTINGTVFTCAASSPGANEFSDIEELTALADGVTNINATEDGTTITITAAAVGTAGNAYTLARSGAGTLAVSGATLTSGVNASLAPTVTTERLLPVVIVSGDGASTVADKVAAALDADASFQCANPASATLSIIDSFQGARTLIAVGTSGFTSPSAARSTPPTVYIKSVSTSQLVVAIAPA